MRFILLFSLIVALISLDAKASITNYKINSDLNLTVAADGSSDFRTVQEAINKIPANDKKRFIINIKQGVYKEQINVPSDKPFVTLKGDNAEKTILTFDLNNAKAGSTSASYSTYIGGHDFQAENITFENSFGKGSQAVAALVEADRATFKNCRFIGWQDTLYAKNGRQFYQNCYIEGHVDFIFGQASAVFENCVIHSKGDGYIAAPMRFAADEPSGFVFIKSKLTGANTEKGVFLGRPWRDYGRTVYIETEMGAHIKPEGWNNWLPEREKTAYFAEYKSTGAGAKPENRVKWVHQLNDSELKQFLPETFLKGADGWNPKAVNSLSSTNNNISFQPVEWKDVLKQPKAWYAVDEASRIADQVVVYQHDNGGWGKNVDMAAMLTQAEREKLLKEKLDTTETTIDNRSTFTQVNFLAKVITASLAKTTPPNNFEKHKTAFFKGLDYLLSSQYANGGFPQYFPLQKGYYTHITYNDDAMIGVLKVMRDIAKKKEDYVFVDEPRRAKAEIAVQKGIECILKTQVKVKNELTVWCAQHDEKTFAPAPARKFEPVSLSGYESVAIVEFLMSIENPNQEIKNSIESAVSWFQKSKINGIKVVQKPDNSPRGYDRVVVNDKTAEPLWARFYDVETNRPIFIGRDTIIKYSLAEIEEERRNGYNYYTAEPNDLLNKNYPKWRQKLITKQGKN